MDPRHVRTPPFSSKSTPNAWFDYLPCRTRFYPPRFHGTGIIAKKAYQLFSCPLVGRVFEKKSWLTQLLFALVAGGQGKKKYDLAWMIYLAVS